MTAHPFDDRRPARSLARAPRATRPAPAAPPAVRSPPGSPVSEGSRTQADRPRIAAGDGPGPPRAAVQDRGAGRLLVGRALLRRLRDRGDPPRPDPGRDRRARVLHPDCHRHLGPRHHRRQLVPPDHPRLPPGRRRLHRQQGQPGDIARPDRRGRPPHRLRADGGRERGGRRRRADLGVSRALRGADLARRALRRRHHHRQPPRPEGIGAALRGAHLSLHRELRGDARVWLRPVGPRLGDRRPRPRSRSRPPRPSACFSSCARSRPGAPPSPAWRPSPTACLPSGPRRRRTPASCWPGSASSWSRCFWASPSWPTTTT